ncbi:MAG: WS/DGAT domain-containing protein [Bacillota bacterium]|nr:WS/DGAT domain-containing protein [Bacillota bacterium]
MPRTVSYRFEAWDMLQHLFKVKSISDHTLRFVAKFSCKLDLNRLKKAVNISAKAFPFVRSTLNENRFRPRWEDKGYTADDMVRFLETSSVDESVNRFICKGVDAFTGPQLMIEVIRNENFDTLCISINHMLCDAAGFKDYLYILSDIYINIDNEPNYKPAAMGDRKISQIFKTFSLQDKLKIMFSKNDILTHDLAKFEFEGDISNPFIEKLTVSKESFCRLKDYAKEHNATVNDVILTAYMRVLFQIFDHPIIVPCVVDLRKYLPNRRAKGICNLCSNLICNIGSDIGMSFEQTLYKVKQVMDKQKADISCIKSLAIMEMVFDILPYKFARYLVNKSYSNANIEFTNIGILDRARLAFGKIEITEAYMAGSIKYAPCFELAVSTFDDRATFCVNLHGTQSDRNIISHFLNELVLELQNAM